MAGRSRKPPEINAGSMADIAFLLLIFFLVTTTMDTDTGMIRMLPPHIIDMPDPPPVKDRNVFIVLVNANNQLLVEGKPMDIKDLRSEAKKFISNLQNEETLPEKVDETIPLLGNVQVSKQIISLQNDRGTSYERYVQVQNELAAAYNELRNEFARLKFQKSFDELVELKEDEKVKAVKAFYPQRISEAEPKAIGGPK